MFRLNILSIFLEVNEKVLTWIQKDGNARHHDALAVLTLLLDEVEMRDVNCIFIEGLFNTNGHEWTPHPAWR